MKKIIFFVFLILLSSFAFALTDNSPVDQPINYSNNPGEQATNISSIQSQLVKINGSIDNLRDKIDTKADAKDLETVRQVINSDAIARDKQLIAQILTLLLVWQAFFFATFFLAISKGWLTNGK